MAEAEAEAVAMAVLRLQWEQNRTERNVKWIRAALHSTGRMRAGLRQVAALSL
jgi:hypothetical protein